MITILRRNSSLTVNFVVLGRSMMGFFSHGEKKVKVLHNYAFISTAFYSTAFISSIQRKLNRFTAPSEVSFSHKVHAWPG